MTCPTGPGSSPSFPTKVDLAKALRCYQLPFDVWSHEIHALFIQAFSPDRKDLGIPSYSMARFFQIRVQIILYKMDQNEAFLHPAHILSISFLIGTNDIPVFFYMIPFHPVKIKQPFGPGWTGTPSSRSKRSSSFMAKEFHQEKVCFGCRFR